MTGGNIYATIHAANGGIITRITGTIEVTCRFDHGRTAIGIVF